MPHIPKWFPFQRKTTVHNFCCECLQSDRPLVRATCYDWVCEPCYFRLEYEIYQPGIHDQF